MPIRKYFNPTDILIATQKKKFMLKPARKNLGSYDNKPT